MTNGIRMGGLNPHANALIFLFVAGKATLFFYRRFLYISIRRYQALELTDILYS